MFEYFVPVVKFFVLLPGIVAYITRGLPKFPCSVSFMVLDFMFQLVDVLQLDVDLVVIMLNLWHGLSAKRTRHYIVKSYPEFR